MNDTLNESELSRLRDFVHSAPATNNSADFTNFLLLNERGDTGERFWNLLHMRYVDVRGELYILGVQTNLDAYMPKSLRKAEEGTDVNQQILAAHAGLVVPLHRLRKELQEFHEFEVPPQDVARHQANRLAASWRAPSQRGPGGRFWAPWCGRV